ncbi:MAG: hypothetical protein M1587_05720 [Thaumarchaeota archaeon]|nr:hypothetical protein [Nitrososphaerota archaeon]
MRTRTIIAAIIILLAAFFLAPVIPVAVFILLTVLRTDWESPSYYLFGFGVHFSRFVPCS